MKVKELKNKKIKKVSWGIFIFWIVFIASGIWLPGITWIPLFIRIPYAFIPMILFAVYILGINSILIKRMEKLESSLNCRAWLKISEALFTEVYVFDLTNGYLYGLCQLNPFYIQKVDLKDVADVEIVTSEAFNSVTTCVIDRIIWPWGKTDIYLQRNRKYHPLPIGCPEDLAYREAAVKLKKLILDLRVIAQSRA